MREIIVAGNWKMNTTPAEGVELVKDIALLVADMKNVTVVVCPPATHLSAIAEVLKLSPYSPPQSWGGIKGGSIELGAQNVHWENSGAFTGEISVDMLKIFDCNWVIIGHSERRTYFGETDNTVNKRLKKMLEAGLRPIVCIGETLDERESGRTFQVLERQLKVGLNGVLLKGEGGLVIAYEPVWAIGTGHTATPDQAQEAHKFIRGKLTQLFRHEAADNTVIQYGGSMNDANASSLLSQPDIDGGLIGGASLKAEKFATIVKAASEQVRM